jgi:putative ABC transport system substrate-binding protein
MKWAWTVCLLVLAAGAISGLAQGAETKARIGISQIVEHPALDANRKGFMDDLKEHGYPPGKNVEFDYKNAQNNRAVSGQIAKTFIGDDVDLIFAISTPSAQDAAAGTKKIPILFSAVTDPVAAGLVKSLETPGGNVTGTTDRSPVEKQLDLILRILPNVKKLGTVYNAGETNSVASVRDLKAEAAKRGIAVIEATAASSSAVKMAAESLVGKVDAIHIPTDNTVVLALESVVKVCLDNKIPLFAADVDSVTRGAIAAVAVDYYQLGRQSGAMARKILEKKAAVSDTPVESQKELLLYLNPTSAEKMGVKLSDDLVKQAAKVAK